MRKLLIHCTSRSCKSQQGSMLLELIIGMAVLATGMGGLLVLLVSSLFTNNKAGKDTTSTMIAEHVIEQISSQPANSVTPLTIADCAGTAWDIETTGAAKGAGSSNSNGGNGAYLTSTGSVDWTQDYGAIPAGYAMRYVSCGAGGRQTIYDVRWNVISMSTYSRMIFVSARPSGSATVGGLRYVIPVQLRTIGGM
jgi:type II secretory pathway pseudopilin PulG